MSRFLRKWSRGHFFWFLQTGIVLNEAYPFTGEGVRGSNWRRNQTFFRGFFRGFRGFWGLKNSRLFFEAFSPKINQVLFGLFFNGKQWKIRGFFRGLEKTVESKSQKKKVWLRPHSVPCYKDAVSPRKGWCKLRSSRGIKQLEKVGVRLSSFSKKSHLMFGAQFKTAGSLTL